jgi:succinylglutamate desuccinylase
MLNILDKIPDGLLELEAKDLHTVLPGPTLIHLEGRRREPLFVSVLLHGNEDTGWLAIRELLSKYGDRELPRSLSILIGNVKAARFYERFMDGQPDYNRIWEDNEQNKDLPERAMVRQVVATMKARKVFASIDIHNNTGLNPHYACVRVLDHAHLHLATLFGRTVVYFLTPPGVQTAPFSELCPSVTVECGQPGQPHGVEHAREYIDAVLHLSEFPSHSVAQRDVDLFHTVAVAKVPESISISFGDSDSDIRFLEDLDYLNFRELPAGTTLGWVKPGIPAVVNVFNDNGESVGEHYFVVEDNELRTVKPVMPSMLTVSTTAIRKDCLCYLMERYPLSAID